MKKAINISIGIPAYNEAGNIKSLLQSILSQTEDGFRIDEILVVSDGSTDATVSEVDSVKDNRIKMIDSAKRLGKSARLSHILNIFEGDVLFMIDGDIKITDQMLFSKILNSTDIDKAGLLGINAMPFKPRGFFQKIISSGSLTTTQIGKTWKNGNNYLLFRGCFLVLSKAFAKSVKIPPEVVNNDAFLYLRAIEQNLSPKFIENAVVYFTPPGNLMDHLKQSHRFKTSRKEMQKHFDFDLKKKYDIPVFVYLSGAIRSVFYHHIYFLGYILINLASKLNKKKDVSSRWNVAFSTKK